MTLPALHIFVDTDTRTIHRVLHDQGDPKALKRMEKYNRDQGLSPRLTRIVICDGQVKVVPPCDIEEGEEET